MKLSIKLCACIALIGVLFALPTEFVLAEQGTTASQEASVAKPSEKKESSAPVNINTADASTLETLKGVGPKRSAAIIAYRQANGPFKSIDDLAKVKNIPKYVLKDNANRITFN